MISQAFAGITQDPAVLSFDRRQRGTFNKSFEQYVSTRVGAGRINIGRQMMLRHASLLSRIEQQYGVPPQIVVAIWGLKSDFGKGDIGKMPVIRTLMTMAHDCRRTELFQGELLAALKILQRGDLPLRDLIGAFAGEIGQTQFLPSSYIKYGVDFDGNGHVDLRHSVPDVLASTANLLHVAGFKPGASSTMRAPRTSKRCASGTGPRSTARPSAILPTGWSRGDISFSHRGLGQSHIRSKVQRHRHCAPSPACGGGLGWGCFRIGILCVGESPPAAPFERVGPPPQAPRGQT